MWAAEALARLGAKQSLIEYLEAPTRPADAQLAFAEDALRNTAARQLGRWRDDGTFAVLLDLCRKRLLPGAVESIVSFGRIDAIPVLDRALEDDLCRTVAEEGMRAIGRRAPLLSAVTPVPKAAEEAPSSLVRRRTVLAILAEMDVGRELGRAASARRRDGCRRGLAFLEGRDGQDLGRIPEKPAELS